LGRKAGILRTSRPCIAYVLSGHPRAESLLWPQCLLLALSGHFDRLRKCPLSGRKQTWRLTASCHFCFSSFALRSSISRNKLPIGLLGSLRRMGLHFLSNSRLASASGPVPYIKRSSSSKSVLGSFLIGLWSFLWSPGAYVGLLSCRVLSFPAKNLAAMAQGRGLNKHSQKKEARGSMSAFGGKADIVIRGCHVRL
jgi:hypothetical protein